MNPELKQLIELLKYRNSQYQPLTHIIITRDLLLMLIAYSSMWIDEEAKVIIDSQGYARP